MSDSGPGVPLARGGVDHRHLGILVDLGHPPIAADRPGPVQRDAALRRTSQANSLLRLLKMTPTAGNLR